MAQVLCQRAACGTARSMSRLTRHDARRPRILVVAALGRPDILRMFDALKRRAEMAFVEYERNWGEGLDPTMYEPYGELTTWEEHRSAGALLDKFQPDRVAMIAIASRDQAALRVEARRRGLEVIHVEHGYRVPPSIKAAPGYLPRSRAGPRASLRTHRFFVGSAVRARGARRRLLSFGLGTLRREPNIAARHADLLRPDHYVSFSPECFEYLRQVDRVPDAMAARTEFVGVPQFDSFRLADAGSPRDEGAVIMADHQLHNGKVRGWTQSFREEWAARLVEILKAQRKRLYVKRHPGDKGRIWDAFTDGTVVEVDTIEALARHAEVSSIALGTGSTLQLPLAAQPHAATIALEIHPGSGPALSGRLVEVGVASAAEDFEGLERLIRAADDLRAGQQPHKDAFVSRFLHRLDGNATERMADALVRGLA
jgi:hypothetical protein